MKGFTLVEVLVVIVILIILVGLLLPTVFNARRAAQQEQQIELMVDVVQKLENPQQTRQNDAYRESQLFNMLLLFLVISPVCFGAGALSRPAIDQVFYKILRKIS